MKKELIIKNATTIRGRIEITYVYRGIFFNCLVRPEEVQKYCKHQLGTWGEFIQRIKPRNLANKTDLLTTYLLNEYKNPEEHFLNYCDELNPEFDQNLLDWISSTNKRSKIKVQLP